MLVDRNWPTPGKTKKKVRKRKEKKSFPSQTSGRGTVINGHIDDNYRYGWREYLRKYVIARDILGSSSRKNENCTIYSFFGIYLSCSSL